MRIAIIEKKDITFHVERSSLKFDAETLPFRLMDVLIINHRVTLGSRDILKLNAEKVALLVVSHDNKNISLLYSVHTSNGSIKQAQYEALSDRLVFAKYFIEQKIKSHAAYLKKQHVETPLSKVLEDIDACTNISSLLGIEGTFARGYFKYYFSQFNMEFRVKTRTKNPPKDPVNALLSFWYSLYYQIITIKLLGMGFDPAIGYLHTPFRAHHALSSDIIEIFRADINEAVLDVFAQGTLQKEDFSYKQGAVYLTFNGRKKSWKAFSDLVAYLDSKLKNEIALLRAKIEKRV